MRRLSANAMTAKIIITMTAAAIMRYVVFEEVAGVEVGAVVAGEDEVFGDGDVAVVVGEGEDSEVAEPIA